MISHSHQTISEITADLRTKARLPLTLPHRLSLLRGLSDFWFERMRGAWRPPTGMFPYAQVRFGLPPLVYGMMDAEQWAERAQAQTPTYFTKAGVVALILAGNTPLLAWSPLLAALLAGHAVFVKLSRDEAVWTPLLVESLATVAPELAERVHFAYFPGDSDETTELCRIADTVIAYGSDDTIAHVRTKTPDATPFYGFGHAISIGIVGNREEHVAQSHAFATDVLMYGQSGCLSAQTIFVLGGPHEAQNVARAVVQGMISAARALQVPNVTDPGIAHAVRRARDMALFEGAEVHGDEALRWTVTAYPPVETMPAPVGHGMVSVVPFGAVSELPQLVGSYRGKISGVATLAQLDREGDDLLRSLGVTYRCAPGQLQCPPLDWANGGVDLLTELLVR